MSFSPALIAWAVGFGVMASVPTGPVALLIIKNTLSVGVRAGLITLASLLCAELIYAVLFVLGLGGSILNTPWLRDSLFLAGAVTLSFVGVQAWREPAPSGGPSDSPASSLGAMFRAGFMITVTNPAVLMIFAGFIASATAVFGAEAIKANMVPALAAMELGTTLWFCIVVVGLARLPARLSARIRQVSNRVAGVALVGFGAWLLIDTLRHLAV